MSAETVEETGGKYEQHRCRSTTEYRCGGIAVRVPTELPPLTPEIARILLKILRELTDEEFRKRSENVDS